MTNLSCVLIPQAHLYWYFNEINSYVIILYSVSYVKAKLAVENEPSELINSVERGEYWPPINKVGPFSPSRFQHKWFNLSPQSINEVAVKSPVTGFNIRQDRDVEFKSPPPHRSLPHWLWKTLTWPGRSARWQLFLVLLLNTSTFIPLPVIMTPGTKYIHQSGKLLILNQELFYFSYQLLLWLSV